MVQESASIITGTGTSSVDMNIYNLVSADSNADDLEVMAAEWTALAMAATALLPEGVYLHARNKQQHMADTVKVSFPRIPGAGLGLELLEIAGGRADGLGITIVANVVEGSAAFGSGILPGDSLVQIDVQRQTKRSSNDKRTIQESQEVSSVPTECLGYDKTVQAIQSLPPPPDNDPSVRETFVLTLKRLRRKPKVQVTLQYPPGMKENDVTLELFCGENLRRALLVRGVKLNDALASRFDSGGPGDCGAEGTCATCAVAIVTGADLLSPMGQQEGQIFAQKPRWRMACKTIVGHGTKEGILTARISPRQWSQ
jgi:ferredoxin